MGKSVIFIRIRQETLLLFQQSGRKQQVCSTYFSLQMIAIIWKQILVDYFLANLYFSGTVAVYRKLDDTTICVFLGIKENHFFFFRRKKFLKSNKCSWTKMQEGF